MIRRAAGTPRKDAAAAATRAARSATPQARRLERWFVAGVLFKGAEGLLELASAAWLAIEPDILHNVVFRLTARELLHDPQDRIAGTLRHLADSVTLGAHSFAVVYLAAHGAIKLALAAGLLSGRRRAYPVAVVVLVLFAVYQLYRFAHTHAPLLPVMSAVDALIAWLVWREGRARRDLA
jgi:uncharacterized membrane protein